MSNTMTMQPFNGDFYDSNGNIRNLMELGPTSGSSPKSAMSPRNGDFYASDGSVHNLAELLDAAGGGDGGTGTGGITAPVSGFFTMHVDNDGNLFVSTADGGVNPFRYDETSGDLYYEIS